MNVTRRQLFKSAALLGGTAISPSLIAKAAEVKSDKTLNVYNIHTGENIKATIWDEGEYQMGEIERLDHLMRDHRSGEVKAIDRDMYELLFHLQKTFDPKQPINIISGYRCQATNSMLRNTTSGVAKKSMHVQGRAIDLTIPGVDHQRLLKAAIAMQAGGVGSYPRSGFIHIDNGRIRRWNG